MKAILEFNLNDGSYDKESFEAAMKATNLIQFIDEFGEFMRKEIKYRAEAVGDAETILMEKWRDKFYELKDENEIFL